MTDKQKRQNEIRAAYMIMVDITLRNSGWCDGTNSIELSAAQKKVDELTGNFMSEFGEKPQYFDQDALGFKFPLYYSDLAA